MGPNKVVDYPGLSSISGYKGSLKAFRRCLFFIILSAKGLLVLYFFSTLGFYIFLFQLFLLHKH